MEKENEYIRGHEENVLSWLYLEVLLEFDWQHLCHDRGARSPPVITVLALGLSHCITGNTPLSDSWM